MFVLSRFPLISDHNKRTQRRPRCVEQIYRAGTRAGEAWATLAATAGDAHGFGDVLSLSLSLFLFILVGLTSWSHNTFFANPRSSRDSDKQSLKKT